MWWKFSAQGWSHPEASQPAGKAWDLWIHPVDSCHAVPLKSSLNVKIVYSHGKTSHPSRLSPPASFQSMLATPSLVCSELSCSCHSLCTWSNLYSCWPQHSFPTLRNGLELLPQKKEVRWVKYRPRCLWWHRSLLNKARVRAQLVKFLTSGMRTQVL